jgi:hypothetical protein
MPHDLTRHPAYDSYHLRPAPGADYSFVIWLYSDGAAEISASRIDHRDGDCFWSCVFEIHDFDDREQLAAALLAGARHLLWNPTRIVQRRGLILWTFYCEFFEDGEWQRFCGHSVARWVRGIPPVVGRERVYVSDPVAGANST